MPALGGTLPLAAEADYAARNVESRASAFDSSARAFLDDPRFASQPGLGRSGASALSDADLRSRFSELDAGPHGIAGIREQEVRLRETPLHTRESRERARAGVLPELAADAAALSRGVRVCACACGRRSGRSTRHATAR